MQKSNNIQTSNEIQYINGTQLYNAALYARLSREDGDKSESDSIGNQRDLIKDFLQSKPEIKLVSERVDDGYSGVTFDRPALNGMLEDVRGGKINCIVVKDLSRFGRNYIEVGRYTRTIFPLLGVRFIAVNDGYDSADGKSLSNDYIIPFKNIINDAYCADISKKIRSQLEIKRKKGDYIGAFTPFGYVKDPNNKNKLVVDVTAAEIVKDIFRWKITGMSYQGIADKLNKLGVLSPYEYKKSLGLGCSAVLKVNAKAKWSPNAIQRILYNEAYTGVLIQGKTTTPNYKVKNLIVKDKSEWVRVEGAHEAIISKEEFALVADLLGRDTRSAPSRDTVYPFSGMVFCSKCGQSIIRKVAETKNGKYYLYMCTRTHKTDKREGCAGIRIKESELERDIRAALKRHIKILLDIEDVIQFIGRKPNREADIKRLCEQINTKKSEIDKLERRKVQLYEDFIDGEICKEDYAAFKKNYDRQIADIEIIISNLERELENIYNENGKNQIDSGKWIDTFRQYRNINELDSTLELSRELIVKLIDKIIVYEDNRLEIIFRYMDEFEQAVKILNARTTDNTDETGVR